MTGYQAPRDGRYEHGSRNIVVAGEGQESVGSSRLWRSSADTPFQKYHTGGNMNPRMGREMTNLSQNLLRISGNSCTTPRKVDILTPVRMPHISHPIMLIISFITIRSGRDIIGFKSPIRDSFGGRRVSRSLRSKETTGGGTRRFRFLAPCWRANSGYHVLCISEGTVVGC